MANYTTNVSDITKGQALKAWAIGLIGTLGFHYFKVGKVKLGIIRLIVGIFFWVLTVMAVQDPELPVVPFVVVLIIISAIDFARIKLGTFTDNIGNVIREK